MITNLIYLTILLLGLIIKQSKITNIIITTLIICSLNINVLLALVIAIILVYLIPKLDIANEYLTLLLLFLVFYKIHLIISIALVIISYFLKSHYKYILNVILSALLVFLLNDMYLISNTLQIIIFVVSCILSSYIKKDSNVK